MKTPGTIAAVAGFMLVASVANATYCAWSPTSVVGYLIKWVLWTRQC
jgi:hypothetical protein